MKRVHVLISGRVQGVNFRWTTKKQADNLGVKGWVRNTPDGQVEAEIQGDDDSVEAMLEFFKKGPPSASVSDVQVQWLESGPFPDDFQLRG